MVVDADLSGVLNSPVFSIPNLATDWNHVTKIYLNENGSPEEDHRYDNRLALENATKENFDNIVIMKSGIPYGFAKKDDIPPDFKIADSNIRKIKDYCLNSSASYIDALDLIVRRDKPRDHGLYFVDDRRQSPMGIFTYADFNKKSVYLYCYTLLSSVELWAKRMISKQFTDQDGWLSLLEPKRKRNTLKYSERNLEKPLDCVGFPDIYKIITSSPELCSKAIREGLTCPVLTSLLRIRDRIAHPVKLLLPRSSYSTLSKDLLNVLTVSRLTTLLSGNDKNW